MMTAATPGRTTPARPGRPGLLPRGRQILLLIVAITGLLSAPAIARDTEKSQHTLMHLLVQDCGSCHGLRMTGGLGPALTPEALASTPRTTLVTTILYGRPGTAMPPWRELLEPDQAEWIVDRLLEGLPPK